MIIILCLARQVCDTIILPGKGIIINSLIIINITWNSCVCLPCVCMLCMRVHIASSSHCLKKAAAHSQPCLKKAITHCLKKAITHSCTTCQEKWNAIAALKGKRGSSINSQKSKFTLKWVENPQWQDAYFQQKISLSSSEDERIKGVWITRGRLAQLIGEDETTKALSENWWQQKPGVGSQVLVYYTEHSHEMSRHKVPFCMGPHVACVRHGAWTACVRHGAHMLQQLAFVYNCKEGFEDFGCLRKALEGLLLMFVASILMILACSLVVCDASSMSSSLFLAGNGKGVARRLQPCCGRRKACNAKGDGQ